MAGLVIAFFADDGLTPPTFVGLDNLRGIVRDPIVHGAVWTSPVIAAVAIPLRVGGSPRAGPPAAPQGAPLGCGQGGRLC